MNNTNKHEIVWEDDECDCPLCKPKVKFVRDYDHCYQCGLKLSEIMSYVCMNPGCPCGLGGPC